MSFIAEANSRHPKHSTVSELMKMSFEMRRNSIIEEPKPLKELLQSYAFFKDCNGVWKLVLPVSATKNQNLLYSIYIAKHMHFLIVVQMTAKLSRINK